MLNDATYRRWTSVFCEGSYFEGDWSEGSEIRFLGPVDENGKESGMYSVIAENRPHEFVSIKHLGEIRSGEIVPWEGEGFENYSFIETEEGTDVRVDLIGMPDEYVPMFNESWPKALEVLKELAQS